MAESQSSCKTWKILSEWNCPGAKSEEKYRISINWEFHLQVESQQLIIIQVLKYFKILANKRPGRDGRISLYYSRNELNWPIIKIKINNLSTKVKIQMSKLFSYNFKPIYQLHWVWLQMELWNVAWQVLDCPDSYIPIWFGDEIWKRRSSVSCLLEVHLKKIFSL